MCIGGKIFGRQDSPVDAWNTRYPWPHTESICLAWEAGCVLTVLESQLEPQSYFLLFCCWVWKRHRIWIPARLSGCKLQYLPSCLPLCLLSGSSPGIHRMGHSFSFRWLSHFGNNCLDLELKLNIMGGWEIHTLPLVHFIKLTYFWGNN